MLSYMFRVKTIVIRQKLEIDHSCHTEIMGFYFESPFSTMYCVWYTNMHFSSSLT